MEKPPTLRKYLTVTELSAMLSMSEGHIRNLMSKGRIPYVKLPTGAVRFDLEAIDAWVKKDEKL